MPNRRPDHVPQRTCAVCRSNHPKSAMRRIVRLEDGSVAWDASGRAEGRGTYVCADCASRTPQEITAAVGRVLHVSVPDASILNEESHAPA